MTRVYKTIEKLGGLPIGSKFVWDDEKMYYAGDNGYTFSLRDMEGHPQTFEAVPDDPVMTVRFYKDYEFAIKDLKGTTDQMKRHNAYMMAMDFLIEEVPQAETNSELFEYEIHTDGDLVKSKAKDGRLNRIPEPRSQPTYTVNAPTFGDIDVLMDTITSDLPI